MKLRPDSMKVLNSVYNAALPGAAMNVGVFAASPVANFRASSPFVANMTYTRVTNYAISALTGIMPRPRPIHASAIYLIVAVYWVID